MEDDYEGDFTTRRALIYTLRFTAKTYLFGPISSSADKDIIKKASIAFSSGDSNSAERDVTYRTTPVATKSYTNNVVATSSQDLQISTYTFNISDSSQISLNDYITIDGETMKVTSIDGNEIQVERGSYGTLITEHVSGTEIKLITSADNDLIEFGDDFGFDTEF
jgi:hypothetical protein